MRKYFDALRDAMTLLSEQPNAIFMGQAVACEGTAMRRTLAHLPAEKLLELPVAEEMQMGMATGMSLGGFLPICIYPRVNFMLLAMGQLCLHLDKLPLYSGYRPKVIIRTAIAHDQPLDPGVQHLGDYSVGIKSMLSTVHVVDLLFADSIVDEYARAIKMPGSFLMIERMELY